MMSHAAVECLPFVILILVCLSIRLERASFRNTLSVTVGAITVGIISPVHSLWGKIISYGLTAVAVAMSPLGLFLFRAIKDKQQSAKEAKSESSKPNGALTNPDPINVLHDPQDAEVDIVAVHGLGSSVETTWTHKTSGKLWLRDFLHLDFPTARIMTYRHNSSWKSQALVKDLADHGRQFLSALEGRRATEESKCRPLILMGHSFGGLIIEQALVVAKGATADPKIHERHDILSNSLAGAIFLGTPHAGSGYSFLGKMYCLFNYWNGGNPILLEYMDSGAKETVKLEDDFLKYYPNLSFDYHETKPNVILGLQFQMVVDRDSGTRRGQECAPLDTDHFGLNKYYGREDASYIAVKNKMIEMLQSWNDKMEEEEIELDASELKLLKKLKPCDFTATVGKRQRDITPKTCQWITKQKAFKAWSAEFNLLWILGNPGSGKTYIAQWICKHLSEDRLNNIMYFFFDAKSEDAEDLRSLNKFYQTILHQLLGEIRKSRPKLKERCFKLVRRALDEGSSEMAYVEALREVLRLASPSFLVVDALDECTGPELGALREWLAKIEGLPNLKIVITSRTLWSIERLSSNPRYINLQLSEVVDELNADIEKFIRNRIKKEDSMFPGEMPRVVEKLKSHSSGMILYARLMIEILESKVGSEDDLLDEMEKLPRTLTAIYADRLNNVRNKRFASNMLQWLVTCRRPLTVDALRGVEIIDRTVWPKNRFELDEENPPKGLGKDHTGKDLFQEHLVRELVPLVEILDDRSIRLVHTTVSQFLLGEEVEENGKQCPEGFRVEYGAGHERIAVTCVTFLRWSFTQDLSARGSDAFAFLDNSDLYEYAVLEWPGHCKSSEARIMANDAEKKILETFFREEVTFSAWLEERVKFDASFRYRFNLGVRSPTTLLPRRLHVAVYFNLWRLGELFLTDTSINALDATNSTALHIAAEQGHLQILKELLKQGASMDMANSSVAFETPIGLAIENDHIDAVKALLDHDQSLVKFCRRPLARFAHRISTEMVTFLCKAGVDTYQGWQGQTALHNACRFGMTHVVKCLLDEGRAPVNVKNSFGWTPLSFAAEGGHADVVDRLLKAGADPTTPDLCQVRPLQLAIMSGCPNVVRMLLQQTQVHQNITNLTDGAGRTTALHKAAAWLHESQEDVIDTLIEHGACPDARDESGGTALHAAVWRASNRPPPTVILLNRLIQHKVPIDARNNAGVTALYLALLARNVSAVSFLLGAGSSRWAQSLLMATLSGDVALVRPFLEQISQLDLAEKDADMNTPLHVAASMGYDEIVASLLAAGAPTKCLNSDRHTPLGVAEKSKHTTTAALLRGADPEPEGNLEARMASSDISQIDIRDALGRTLLHTAVLAGRIDVFPRLFEARANANNADNIGWTPLHYASQRADSAMVKALIAAGANVDINDAWGRVPLYLAAEGGNETVVQALLAAEAEPMATCDLRTPLHAAALGGFARIVRAFLEPAHVEEQIFMKDSDGQTAIHLAAKRGHCKVVEELLIHPGSPAKADILDNDGRSALFPASENGHLEVVRLLIESGSLVYRTDKLLDMAIHLAAENGHLETVKLLLSKLPNQVESALEKWKDFLPAFPREDDFCGSGIFRALIGNKALVEDPEGLGWSLDPSMWATPEKWEKLQRAVVSSLRTFGENIHSSSGTPLLRAVDGGHLDVARFLLDEVPEMPLQACHHEFPNVLSLAAGKGYTAIVRLLIASGAEINHLTNYQETCLHEAAKNGRSEVVELLLQSGAAPDLVRLHDGYTPLHLATECGYESTVRALVSVASPNTVNGLNFTPLHLACLKGYDAIVNVLIDADANLEARDFIGKTPSELGVDLREKTRIRLEEQAEKQRRRRAARH